MGFLLHIFLAVGIQVLAEAGYDLDLRAPWAFFLLAAVPYVLGRRARKEYFAGRFQRAARLERSLHFCAPFLHAVFALACGWVHSVRAWTGSQLTLLEWPEPALFLALAPFVVLQLLAIDAQARIQDTRPAERTNLRRFQTRMFCSALIPILIYIAIASLVGQSETLRLRIEHITLYNALFVTGVLATLSVTLPALLKNTWETVPIEHGVQRALLSSVAERARFRCRALLKWRTGNLMANAAIVGFVPWQRVVIFSDALLGMLSLRQLAAVFAHEMGHAKRHHVAIFVCWALAFALGGTALVEQVAGDSEAWTLALGLVVLGAWFFSFGWLSRRFELEADLYSLELLNDPEAMTEALEIVGGRQREAPSWRHFSTARRVAFIRAAAADPGLVRSFRRRLRRFSVASVVAAFAALGVQGYLLAQDYLFERVVLELALGRYEGAAELASHGELDDALVLLVDEARALQATLDRAPSVADLESALTAAVRDERLATAVRFAELLLVRGEPGLLPIVDALEALELGDDATYQRHLSAASKTWRERIEGARQ